MKQKTSSGKTYIYIIAGIFAVFASLFLVSGLSTNGYPWHNLQNITSDGGGTISIDANSNGKVDDSDNVTCVGCVNSTDINFNYAGSTSKGGAASDLVCAVAGCVGVTDIDTAAVQARVDAAGCPAGSSIRLISAAGAVTCETDDFGTGTVTSTGSANYIPMFTSGTNVGNSVIYQDAANEVGIGTTTPGYTLDVNGRVNAASSSGNGGYISTGNYGGTGTAAYFPSGIWSNGATSWIYGNVYFSSGSTWITNTGDAHFKAFYYESDRNLKQNIQPLSDSLSRVQQLEGVNFEWKKDGTKSVGLIAQDVEKIYPELVSTDENGMKSVQYGNLVAPLIEAVKEQQKQIEAQQKEIDALKAEIEEMKN
jgi:hypothetical protein